MGAVVALCRLRLAHSGADAMLRVLQERLPALSVSLAPPAAMERLWAVLQAGVAVAGTLISDADLSTMHQDWKVQPGGAAHIEGYKLRKAMQMCRRTVSVGMKVMNYFDAALQLSECLIKLNAYRATDTGRQQRRGCPWSAAVCALTADAGTAFHPVILFAG